MFCLATDRPGTFKIDVATGRPPKELDAHDVPIRRRLLRR